ncbi:hypothetical protein IEQ34_014721 [Dendrobium chrysotoxum]|uniref:Uncharacterized protein n=1 Tax=Dendrobium chrysotoxum TaxID=161865 RepID=A0AAV7GMX4_DENCH|nr:hypothetical protein IEQ34_014721 [Dendrobium chrysotoxum]
MRIEKAHDGIHYPSKRRVALVVFLLDGGAQLAGPTKEVSGLCKYRNYVGGVYKDIKDMETTTELFFEINLAEYASDIVSRVTPRYFETVVVGIGHYKFCSVGREGHEDRETILPALEVQLVGHHYANIMAGKVVIIVIKHWAGVFAVIVRTHDY